MVRMENCTLHLQYKLICFSREYTFTSTTSTYFFALYRDLISYYEITLLDMDFLLVSEPHYSHCFANTKHIHTAQTENNK